MRKQHLFLGLLILLFGTVRAAAAEAATDSDKKAEAKPKTQSTATASSKPKEGVKTTAPAKKTTAAAEKSSTAEKPAAPAKKTVVAEEKPSKVAEGKTKSVTPSEKQEKTTPVAISSQDSLVLSEGDNGDYYVVVRSDTDEVVTMRSPMGADEIIEYEYAEEEQVAEYLEEEDMYVFPNGEVVMIKKSSPSLRTTYAWNTFGIDKNYEKEKGFVVYADAGYKWVFLRKMGFDGGGHSMRRNLTISGGAAAVGFGYSFGNDVPLALEVDFGIGPNLEFHNEKTFGGRRIDMRQKLNIYNLDASIDYDFKTCNPITPFIGINTGLALVSDRGVMKIYDGGSAAPTVYGEYKRKHRVNLMGGLRLGAKVQVHKNVTISAVAEYNYMGDIQAQKFALSDGSTASTRRIKAHEFNLKLGARLQF